MDTINIRIMTANHQKLELIKAKDRELKSFDDVIARLIEEWGKTHK